MSRVFKRWESFLKKELSKPPKIRITPITKTDEKHVEVMKYLIEQEWVYIQAKIDKQVNTMVNQCFLLGNHSWKGYGVANKHMCKRCHIKTPVIYDPQFFGGISVGWDKEVLG